MQGFARVVEFDFVYVVGILNMYYVTNTWDLLSEPIFIRNDKKNDEITCKKRIKIGQFC